MCGHLGTILYEMLAGRPPFRGASMTATLDQVRHQEPAPLPSTIPRDLQAICLKCLRKQVGARYNSALAPAQDLANFRSAGPILARPRPGSRRLRRCVVPLAGALVLVGGSRHHPLCPPAAARIEPGRQSPDDCSIATRGRTAKNVREWAPTRRKRLRAPWLRLVPVVNAPLKKAHTSRRGAPMRARLRCVRRAAAISRTSEGWPHRKAVTSLHPRAKSGSLNILKKRG